MELSREQAEQAASMRRGRLKKECFPESAYAQAKPEHLRVLQALSSPAVLRKKLWPNIDTMDIVVEHHGGEYNPGLVCRLLVRLC